MPAVDLYTHSETVPAAADGGQDGIPWTWDDQPAGAHVIGLWAEVPGFANDDFMWRAASFQPDNQFGDGMTQGGAYLGPITGRFYNYGDTPQSVILHLQVVDASGGETTIP